VTPEELARQATAVESEAERALDGSALNLPPDAARGAAIPVHALEGRLESWLVPIVLDDWVVAYLRFSPHGMLRGSVNLLEREGALAACPLAEDWLDVTVIQERALVMAFEDETAGAPMLSFDGAPDQLAWAVPLRSDAAGERWVFVSGADVWEALG